MSEYKGFSNHIFGLFSFTIVVRDKMLCTVQKKKKKIIFQGSRDIDDWSNGCLSYILKGSFTQK